MGLQIVNEIESLKSIIRNFWSHEKWHFDHEIESQK